MPKSKVGTSDSKINSKKAKSFSSLEVDLKKAIRMSGLTHYSLAKLAGCAPSMLDRFMSGERDLRFSTAGRIADALCKKLL